MRRLIILRADLILRWKARHLKMCIRDRILSEPEVTAIADIKMGTAEATAWGCDLTYDYVKINADYRS